MNFNVPNILDAAVPKPGQSNRNVAVIGNNMNGPNHNDPGFLSDDFPKTPPKLYITSEDDDFDLATVNEWRAEGFNVEYLPMGKGGKEYKLRLDGLRKVGLGPCENFGIIAYGEAASQCLEHFHLLDNNPDFKLALLVAYYPTRIPNPQGRYPGGVQVLVHLAGDSVGVVKQSQMVGIQGRKRTGKKKIDRGVGTGCLVRMAFSAFSYPEADPGFAEKDLDSYDKVAADLAWDRSIAAARKAFRWDTNVNGVVEENMECKFFAKDENRLMKTYTKAHEAHTTFMPTLVGGVGNEELARFYGDFFLESNPESMQVTLVSRTSSANRVVDELHISFEHTQGMPWILPGIPPTNKYVEIMVISIVTLKGGKIYHEHIYWDQASVLVQVGLLNQNMLPKSLKAQGVQKLPVVGKEPAERIIDGGFDDGEGAADNDLLPEFWDYSEDEDDGQDDEDEEEEDGYDDDDDEDAEDVDEEEEEERQPQPRPQQKQQQKPQQKQQQQHLSDKANGKKPAKVNGNAQQNNNAQPKNNGQSKNNARQPQRGRQRPAPRVEELSD
ncbi:dienelactone hydrolase [Seiridium cupressi]